MHQPTYCTTYVLQIHFLSINFETHFTYYTNFHKVHHQSKPRADMHLPSPTCMDIFSNRPNLFTCISISLQLALSSHHERTYLSFIDLGWSGVICL